jgi:NlpC/P60 family/Bacterial dipeptidyl-peptidase Sh3 domain
MADSFDKRLTPARPDLAAADLEGKVDAACFVEGFTYNIAKGRASLRSRPSNDAPQDSELLFGEDVTIYEDKDGWAWVQAWNDSYVGYVLSDCLGDTMAATLRVSALMAPVFSAADLKSPVRDLLPMNAVVPVLARDGDYVNVGPGFVHRRHLLPEAQKDFVAIAERFLGAPYVWGGKTVAGLDCSGLIQTALQAVGKAAPRDTDLMEKALGEGIAIGAARRGDLVFWKGHMGVMLDEGRLLHANAHHMMVAIEPLVDAIARIDAVAGPVTSVKRL